MNDQWSRVISDPALNRLMHRINKRYLFMGEEDLLWLVLEFEKAGLVQIRRKEAMK